jgi:dolichol kinase
MQAGRDVLWLPRSENVMDAPMLRRELRRKLMQAAGLVFVPFGRAGALALVALIALDVVHLALRRSTGLPGWRRIRQLGERGKERDIGPILLAAGAAIVLVAVRDRWAWAVLCQLFLADSAAAVAGMSMDGPRWPRTHRTLAGSAVFFVIAGIVPLALGMNLSSAVTLAAVGTIVEAYSPRGFDNLLIPLAGLGVWYGLG